MCFGDPRGDQPSVWPMESRDHNTGASLPSQDAQFPWELESSGLSSFRPHAQNPLASGIRSGNDLSSSDSFHLNSPVDDIDLLGVDHDDPLERPFLDDRRVRFGRDVSVRSNIHAHHDSSYDDSISDQESLASSSDSSHSADSNPGNGGVRRVSFAESPPVSFQLENEHSGNILGDFGMPRERIVESFSFSGEEACAGDQAGDGEGGHLVTRAQPPSSAHEDLRSIVQCIICLDTVKSARMCPYCSKLCCQRCLEQWLNSYQSRCPHCRRELTAQRSVKCLWVAPLIEKLEAMDTQVAISQVSVAEVQERDEKNSDVTDCCPEHKEFLRYFCADCCEPLCGDCIVLNDKHRSDGHIVKMIDQVYEEKRQEVRDEMQSIVECTEHLKEIRQQLEFKDAELQLVLTHGKEKLRDIFAHGISRFQRSFEKQFRLIQQESEKTERQLDLMGQMSRVLDVQLDPTVFPRSQFIARSDQLVEWLRDMKKDYSIVHPNVLYVDADIACQSDLIPKFCPIQKYTVPNFGIVGDSQKSGTSQDSIRFPSNHDAEGDDNSSTDHTDKSQEKETCECALSQAKVLFSEPVIVDGISWILKVYPRGNAAGDNEFVSVFVQMLNCPGDRRKARSYDYFVKLEHPSLRGRCISRKFSSLFVEGESWGYNKFYRIRKIVDEGFVFDDNSIRFQFAVRPSTFEVRAQDLQDHVKFLQDTVDILNKSSSLNSPTARSENGEPVSLETSNELLLTEGGSSHLASQASADAGAGEAAAASPQLDPPSGVSIAFKAADDEEMAKLLHEKVKNSMRLLSTSVSPLNSSDDL